jgi:hypothetical protein
VRAWQRRNIIIGLVIPQGGGRLQAAACGRQLIGDVRAGIAAESLVV